MKRIYNNIRFKAYYNTKSFAKMEQINEYNSSDENEQISNTNSSNKDKNKTKKKNKLKAKTQTQTHSKSKPQSAMAKLIMEQRRLQEEEDARVRALEEEIKRKEKEEEDRLAEIKRKEDEEKERKKKVKHDKIEAQKKAGTYMTKSEKERMKKNQLKLEQMKQMNNVEIGPDGKICLIQKSEKSEKTEKSNLENTKINCLENSNNAESDNESDNETEEPEKQEEQEEQEESKESDKKNDIKIQYKCPIFTILGHVDVGKTTLLDNLRQTSIQAKEVGGITQQIGTTFIDIETMKKRISEIDSVYEQEIKTCDKYKIPGLLMIDTPGHEVFANLRKGGARLADLAIVIIDLVHGLEPQTIESIKLLSSTQTPFIFALNKIDRLYGFEYNQHKLSTHKIRQIIESQDQNTKSEFESRYKQVQTQIMELGINNELVWANNSIEDTISVCPISASKGIGIPDLLEYIITYSQTYLEDKIIWKPDLDCIVMEITNLEGYGYVADCLLKNGELKKGSIIRIQIKSKVHYTQIKNILTTPPNKDSKHCTKNLIQHDSIIGSSGIKIYADGLENIIIGSVISLGTTEEFELY